MKKEKIIEKLIYLIFLFVSENFKDLEGAKTSGIEGFRSDKYFMDLINPRNFPVFSFFFVPEILKGSEIPATSKVPRI